MKPILHTVEQRTQAWHDLRLGRVTASRLADLCAKTKTGWGASRANLMSDLITERLSGKPSEQYTNASMQWGVEQEPNARSLYSLTFDVDVDECGIYQHGNISDFLASPDGLVGDDGLVEYKCPNTSTMVERLLDPDKIPNKYLLQCQGQLACSGKAWVDLCYYDPRLPAEYQMLTRRIYRDDKLISEIEDLVKVFLTELDETVLRLRELYKQNEANDDKRRTGTSTTKRPTENSRREELLPAANV